MMRRRDYFQRQRKLFKSCILPIQDGAPPVKVARTVFPEHLPSKGVVRIDGPVFPERISSPGTLHLVCPPPNSSCTKISMKQKLPDEGTFGLYALKDFHFGEKVYDFWTQTWPDTPHKFDMVFGTPVDQDIDPPEGTVIHISTSNYARRNSNGLFRFSGWEMLTAHSCEPNVVYDDGDDSDDDADDEGWWRTTYAAREIKTGDEITVYYNCLLWDCTQCETVMDGCKCGAAKCAGTAQGFKFLPREEQEERKLMSWRRIPPPYKGEDEVIPGEALSAYVRLMIQKDTEQSDDAIQLVSSSDWSNSGACRIQSFITQIICKYLKHDLIFKGACPLLTKHLSSRFFKFAE